MALNKVVLMGRLVRDVELRQTQSGIPVAKITLAVDRDIKNDSGSYDVDFLDVVAWRNTAEFAAKYFRKGSQCVVAGRIQTRKWETQNGDKRTAFEIVAENIYFAGTKQTDTAPAQTEAEAPAQTGAYSQDVDGMEEVTDEDLPF